MVFHSLNHEKPDGIGSLPGEEGYELFFIEAGTVSVLAIEASEEREITTLSQGADGGVFWGALHHGRFIIQRLCES